MIANHNGVGRILNHKLKSNQENQNERKPKEYYPWIKTRHGETDTRNKEHETFCLKNHVPLFSSNGLKTV